MKSLLTLLTIFLFLDAYSQQNGIPPAESPDMGNTYAVVIGISDYQDPAIPDLRFADKDAMAFAEYLRSESGGSLDEDHLKVFLNEEATMAQFAMALDWLWEVAKENDRVFIYFSGHGDVEKKSLTQPGFLLCWDAPSQVYMSGGAFSLGMLQEVISTLSVSNKAKVLVITDACRSGKLSGNDINGAKLTGQNLAKQFANEIKILSCQPDEYSIEGEQWGGGRGAFSYHLIDGLYGLADNNGDLAVNLMEISRYLEDRVPEEVSPQSQVPMILGGRAEKIAFVAPQVLAALKAGKATELPVFSSTETRGIEDAVLATLDSGIVRDYLTFKSLLKEKKFFAADGGSSNSYADYFFEKLTKITELGPLHSAMLRNYAAALQDDAQQAINIWLKADVKQLQCIGKTLRLDPIPAMLDRAADLLGPDHYMYRSLKSRQYLFEGIIEIRHDNPDEAMAAKSLALLRQSARLEPQSPLPWHRMALVFEQNLRQSDSALYCAERAYEIAPNWVLPFVDLAHVALQVRNNELAERALLRAEAIQPDHPYVINRKANLNFLKDNFKEAVMLFERYDSLGGPKYPCWHNDYSLSLERAGRVEEAEKQLHIALEMDSTSRSILGNLGALYNMTGRLEEGIKIFKKLLMLDSTMIPAWHNLAYAYFNLGKLEPAEKALEHAISIDSTIFHIWMLMGQTSLELKKYDKAIHAFKKVIELNPDFIVVHGWLAEAKVRAGRFDEAEAIYTNFLQEYGDDQYIRNQLGYMYILTGRYLEAEPIFLKLAKEIPDKPSILNNLANVYSNTGREVEGEKMFLRALEVEPNFPPTYKNYAKLLSKMEKYEEAIQVLIKGIDLDTTATALREMLGFNYCYKQDFEKASDTFQKLLAVNPSNFWAMAGLGLVAFEKAHYPAAFDWLEKATLSGLKQEMIIENFHFRDILAREEWKIIANKNFQEKD